MRTGGDLGGLAGPPQPLPSRGPGRCGLPRAQSTKEFANASAGPRATASSPRRTAALTSSCTSPSEWVTCRDGVELAGDREGAGVHVIWVLEHLLFLRAAAGQAPSCPRKVACWGRACPAPWLQEGSMGLDPSCCLQPLTSFRSVWWPPGSLCPTSGLREDPVPAPSPTLGLTLFFGLSTPNLISNRPSGRPIVLATSTCVPSSLSSPLP